MSDARPSLYDMLTSVRPDDLTENAWASRAGVSRSFFQDVKRGTSPRQDTLEKVLAVAGLTLGQFYDQAPGMPRPSSPRALPLMRSDDLRDVPLMGTAQGSDMEVGEDGNVRFVERMDLSLGTAVDYVRRPPALANKREVYAITVVGDSMADRYREGDPAYIDPKRQPRSGDYVVVQLRDGEGELRLALLKQLVRRTSTLIELEQANPAIRFTLPIQQVAAVHRVIPWDEIIFF